MTGCAFTVYEEIAFGPCNLALPEAEVRRRDAVPAGCQTGAVGRYPLGEPLYVEQLSGGVTPANAFSR